MSRAREETRILQVVFYRRVAAVDTRWYESIAWPVVQHMLRLLTVELKGFGVELRYGNDLSEMQIHGYADVLNSIRLRYPAGGFTNTCLGHIIGRSPNCDLTADLKRGVNRILFAPETIEPQGSDKIVCHNCGCGC